MYNIIYNHTSNTDTYYSFVCLLTSGFGSLGRDEDYRSNEGEEVGTLRHVEALDSFDSGYPEEKYDSRSTVTLRPKKQKLFASALKVFRRKSKESSYR